MELFRKFRFLLSLFRPVFVKEVECGHATSYALTGEGRVYSWGKGLWGALGRDPEEEVDEEQDQPQAKLLKSLSQVSEQIELSACVLVSSSLLFSLNGKRLVEGNG